MIQNFTVGEVLLQRGVSNHTITKKILDKLPSVNILRYIDDDPERGFSKNLEEMGKQTLDLLDYKGEFLKPCPGTKNYICCGYQILNVATNCPLDCSYCILQSYFNRPYLRIFTNLEEELEKVMRIIDSDTENIFRVGTGEFTDSLALDPLIGWSEMLLPRFAGQKNAILELKTKTTNVRGLLVSNSRDRIVVSWSLNSPYIAVHEEHGAATLRSRLEAARTCQQEGFVLGFHFDPLIAHPMWKDEYMKTIDLMDKYLDPKKIIWVSIGSFRYMPELKEIIRMRHPNSCVLDGEFITGLDGKMRYFKPIRIELYSFMRENLEKWYPDLGTYLCMESDEVWEKSMLWSPRDSNGLRQYLDNRVRVFFG